MPAPSARRDSVRAVGAPVRNMLCVAMLAAMLLANASSFADEMAVPAGALVPEPASVSGGRKPGVWTDRRNRPSREPMSNQRERDTADRATASASAVQSDWGYPAVGSQATTVGSTGHFPPARAAGYPRHDRPLLGRVRTWFAPVDPQDYETWLNRPFSFGWYAGVVQGTPLVSDWLSEGAGFWGGYRLGWDYDEHWGAETRFSFGNMRLWDSPEAKQAQAAADDARRIATDDPFRDRYDGRDAWLWQWDLVLMYYQRDVDPWRPYLLWGVGLSEMRGEDRMSNSFSGTYFAMPIGVGVKFRRHRWLAFRIELTDNIVFPNDFNTVHHLSFNAGLEYRFGGSRRTYWPWVPGRTYAW